MALHQPTSSGHISSAHRTGNDKTMVRMNIVDQKKKNMGKKEAGEKTVGQFQRD